MTKAKAWKIEKTCVLHEKGSFVFLSTIKTKINRHTEVTTFNNCPTLFLWTATTISYMYFFYIFGLARYPSPFPSVFKSFSCLHRSITNSFANSCVAKRFSCAISLTRNVLAKIQSRSSSSRLEARSCSLGHTTCSLTSTSIPTGSAWSGVSSVSCAPCLQWRGRSKRRWIRWLERWRTASIGISRSQLCTRLSCLKKEFLRWARVEIKATRQQ